MTHTNKHSSEFVRLAAIPAHAVTLSPSCLTRVVVLRIISCSFSLSILFFSHHSDAGLSYVLSKSLIPERFCECFPAESNLAFLFSNVPSCLRLHLHSLRCVLIVDFDNNNRYFLQSVLDLSPCCESLFRCFFPPRKDFLPSFTLVVFQVFQVF